MPGYTCEIQRKANNKIVENVRSYFICTIFGPGSIFRLGSVPDDLLFYNYYFIINNDSHSKKKFYIEIRYLYIDSI